ncbi:exodeoxyribonuclease VII small subunit [Candidatus Saccharibacteria bacterium]|nr:exodeoxyribonuclease VII small subunit [Candidatus Saccharibacteria bacterium]
MSNQNNNQNSPKNTNISEKITTLNQKIQWFYSDDFSLDSALNNYQSAINLAKEIETDLNSLKNQITVLTRDFTK